jgi:hypothetical protein
MEAQGEVGVASLSPLRRRRRAGVSRRVSPATRAARGKNLPALLVAALNAPPLATTDRCRRNNDQAAGDGRPAGQQIDQADLRATKMLIDMLKRVEQKAGSARAVL